MDTISLGYSSLYMQTIFEKCLFKENGKLLKLFFLILQGLNLPVGSDTCRTNSCEVSEPAEQDPAGYQTPQNQVLRGYQTPQNNDRDVCIA
jgi:hypothetical protein